MNNGFQVEKRAFKYLVDYNEVEFLALRQFLARIGQAQLDHLGRVLTAARQAGAQLVPARRQHEDEDGVGKQLLDLQRALPVDFEHHVAPGLHARLDRLARCAVAVAVHQRPLEKIAGGDLGVEGLVVDEKVFAAVFFLSAWRARGVRNGRRHPRIHFQQGVDEARLARTAGRRDDK